MEVMLAVAAVAKTDFVAARGKQKRDDVRAKLKAVREKMAKLKAAGVKESKEKDKKGNVTRINRSERHHNYHATRSPEYQHLKEQEAALSEQLLKLMKERNEHSRKKTAERAAKRPGKTKKD